MLRHLEFIRQPLHLALAQGRYDDAFGMLHNLNVTEPQIRASVHLQLAELFSLYGEQGLSSGMYYLQEARFTDSELAKHPLYRALYWEFAAYRGEPASDIQMGVKSVLDMDYPVAIFHCARALYAVQAQDAARDLLSILAPMSLPSYLSWRRWSFLARCYEDQDLQAAAEAYVKAVDCVQGEERHQEVLRLARVWLKLNQPQQALAALENLEMAQLTGAREEADVNLLKGRAQLKLGNFGLALEHLWFSEQSEIIGDDVAFELKFLLADCLYKQGKQTLALKYFHEALKLVAHEASAAKHDLALALLEAGALVEAKELLEDLTHDADYANRTIATVDLADVYRYLGQLDEAEQWAIRALDLGLIVEACLCLGQIALDQYRFDCAIEYFEQALGDSHRGSSAWIMAHKQLASTYVLQGYQRPEQVIRHAQAALDFLPSDDAWVLILQAYSSKAQDFFSGNNRWLN